MTNTEAQTEADLALLQALWDAQKAAFNACYKGARNLADRFDEQLLVFMKVEPWDEVAAIELTSRVTEILEHADEDAGMTVERAINVFIGWED
ncbi:MAG: hypothetical protein WC054_00140 [Candidatus Nanopelagicales bacterium]